MSVRIYPAPQTPCPVCDGSQQVEVASVVPTGIGRDRVRHLPTNLMLVIDCPQCTGAEELLAHLPRKPGAGTGGAA